MKQPNILLIILDATRADHCSPYNPAQPFTPALAGLAAEGTVFEAAYACAPWTLPAMASIFTGLYPSQTNIEATRNLAPSEQTLAALLHAHGYATFAISKNSWFGSEFGLPHGFDVFYKLWQVFQTETDINQVSLTQAYPGAPLVVGALKSTLRGNWFKNAANLATRRVKLPGDTDYGAWRTLKPLREWISAQRGPWFAVAHYLEAHLEYKPPVDWARRFVDDWPPAQKLLAADQWRLCYRHMTGVERLTPDELRMWRQLYAAEVAYQDHAMGQLTDWLRQTGRAEDTLIIVAADHGESLGERGLLNHGYGITEPLLRVPLVMRGPGAESGKRVAGLVQTNDIYGTALSAAGVDLPAHARNLLDGNATRPYIVAEYGQPRVPHQDLLVRYGLQAEDFAPFMRGLTAVRAGDDKLVVDSGGAVELYDLAADPGETVNRAAERPDKLAHLRNLLTQWKGEVEPTEAQLAAPAAPPAIAPEVVERLKALGYLD